MSPIFGAKWVSPYFSIMFSMMPQRLEMGRHRPPSPGEPQGCLPTLSNRCGEIVKHQSALLPGRYGVFARCRADINAKMTFYDGTGRWDTLSGQGLYVKIIFVSKATQD